MLLEFSSMFLVMVLMSSGDLLGEFEVAWRIGPRSGELMVPSRGCGTECSCSGFSGEGVRGKRPLCSGSGDSALCDSSASCSGWAGGMVGAFFSQNLSWLLRSLSHSIVQLRLGPSWQGLLAAIGKGAGLEPVRLLSTHERYTAFASTSEFERSSVRVS